MPPKFSDSRSSSFAIGTALSFLRENLFAVVVISALLVIPCFWHSRIQAGDLGSHVYNGWLAQLIEHHQISGLTVARQWSNILFHLLILHPPSPLAFPSASKIFISF